MNEAQLSLAGFERAVIVRASGREGVNELSEFVVDVLHDDGGVDVEGLVDLDAVLSFRDAASEIAHHHLVVVEATHRGYFNGRDRYRLILRSPLVRLEMRVNHEVFQEKTTQEIVASLLERAGFPSDKTKWRLAGQYAKRVYAVQYGESDWAFAARLLADEGINYWFEQQTGDALLVFGDHPTSHEGLEGDNPVVPLADSSGLAVASAAIHRLERTWSIAATRYVVRDIDVQNPDMPVDGEDGEGSLELYEYPSNLMLADAATARAKVRLEQARRDRTTLSAASGNARVRPGRVLEVKDAADEVHNGKFVVTRVDHSVTQAGVEGAEAHPYANHAHLIPHREEEPYRPAAPVNVPSIEGVEEAIVTGAAGEEVHVDDLGRVKVRFYWDRSGVGDDKSSRWVRTLQTNLNSPQILPRVGWEVPVVYENGDPDRPFVLGRVYNGAAPTPYGLPAKNATSTFQTATSPADGTTHEIRLSDDAGSEEAFIHATRDQTVVVGGSHKVEVSGNRSDDVQKTQSLLVDGSQTTTIGGNQKITVGANGGVMVKGARVESVGANENIGVTGTYKLTSQGAYTEVVGGFYSLRCNQSNATIQGAFTQVIGAALSVTAGLGSNQSVAGARTELVGGTRSLDATLAYADGTFGVKSIKAGSATEDASTDMAWNAKARMQVQADGAMTIDGGGKIVFEAANITFKASTLTAKGGSTMKLSGGLKASSTIKLDATTTKKTDKVKVEG